MGGETYFAKIGKRGEKELIRKEPVYLGQT